MGPWFIELLLLLMIVKTRGDEFFTDDLTGFDLTPKFTSYPRLFFGQEDVETLQQRAFSTHRHIAAELEAGVKVLVKLPKHFPPEDHSKFTGMWNEVFGNNLPPLALQYVLSKDADLLDFIKKYMDQLMEYPQWYVASMPNDEVPVAHTLVGFATAYDMLHPFLDPIRQEKYAEKIFEVTNVMFEAAQYRFWGHVYLQNHQATNVVAILLSSLVLDLYGEQSQQESVHKWKEFAVQMYERTMKLLEGISDGSLNEGVGYTTYTTRSLIQYVYLVKRHFGYDHSKHPWLKAHFDYMYLTILPGLERTVGIADSTQVWFYGPEAQLNFLDSFVLRDGRGNWLAHQVKNNKIFIMKEKRAWPQRYVTLHLEFLFYDGTIDESPPEGFADPELHVFDDWGVVTYRSGSILDRSATFLSFKSGKVHGEYIHTLANTVKDSTFKGWTSVNPGHEHPDQNSFTVWMKGTPLISEGMYAKKLPYLDNVLMFMDPTLNNKDQYTSCTYPWVGQLGVCQKWLQWNGPEEKHSYGQIITAQDKNGMVFVSGESSGAYTRSLGLDHVFRSTLLVDEEIVVVLDHVTLKPSSKVTHVAAFFNNFLHVFKSISHAVSNLSGLTLKDHPRYRAFWLSVDSQSPHSSVMTETYETCCQPVNISTANVTFKVPKERDLTIAYVLVGPNVDLGNVSLSKSLESGSMVLETMQNSFKISIALNQYDIQNEALCTVIEQNTKHFTQFFAPNLSDNSSKEQSVLPKSDHHIPRSLSTDRIASDLKIQVIFMSLLCVVYLTFSRRRKSFSWAYYLVLGLLGAILFWLTSLQSNQNVPNKV